MVGGRFLLIRIPFIFGAFENIAAKGEVTDADVRDESPVDVIKLSSSNQYTFADVIKSVNHLFSTWNFKESIISDWIGLPGLAGEFFL